MSERKYRTMHSTTLSLRAGRLDSPVLVFPSLLSREHEIWGTVLNCCIWGHSLLCSSLGISLSIDMMLYVGENLFLSSNIRHTIHRQLRKTQITSHQLLLRLQSLLNTGNSVTQTQCNPLSLWSNPYVARKLAIVVFLLLHGHIDKSIFPKHAVIWK